ncbi:MAG: hypothetical protein FJX59_04145 [Alphaproteobacteria bacterium]|nr:hypothetical protein [Alphaproteobacteria bacterium]
MGAHIGHHFFMKTTIDSADDLFERAQKKRAARKRRFALSPKRGFGSSCRENHRGVPENFRSWPCVYEFISVVTHSRIYSDPTPPSQSFDAVESWGAAGNLQMIGESDGFLAKLRNSQQERGSAALQFTTRGLPRSACITVSTNCGRPTATSNNSKT